MWKDAERASTCVSHRERESSCEAIALPGIFEQEEPSFLVCKLNCIMPFKTKPRRGTAFVHHWPNGKGFT